MGHYRGAWETQRAQPHETYSDGHNVLHHDPTQDTFLHGQLDSTHGPHFFSLRFGLLLAGRGRREGHTGHQHSPVTGCVPAARLQDSSADIARLAAHRQISSIHFYYEHVVHIGDGGHHQLEFQGSANPSNAQLDSSRLPQVSSYSSTNETTQEDPTPVDDGTAGRRLRKLR